MQSKTILPTAPTDRDPATIVWQELNPDGSKYSLLEGVKDVEGGAFSYVFFIPAGMWDAPHFHSTASYIRVLAGELRLGYGETLDKEKVQVLKPGDTLLVPGGVVHFDGSDEDTLIVGNATGVWATKYL